MTKGVMDMTPHEYRQARAELIRRSAANTQAAQFRKQDEAALARLRNRYPEPTTDDDKENSDNGE